MKHNFTVGQNVVWHSHDFDGDAHIKAVITKVEDDHCIATTQGNKNPNQNDMQLWIDEDNEFDFYDASMVARLSR